MMARAPVLYPLALGFAILVIVAMTGCSDTSAGQPAGSPGALGVPSSNASVIDSVAAGEKQASAIKVAAAADLRTVMTDINSELEDACETKITLVFGSSGQMKTQIEAGADFGLYLSADIQYPVDLAEAGLVAPGGVASYGVGRIAIATRPGLEPVSNLDGLSRPDIKRVAIANPDHAPYGRAAQQALENAGVYASIQDKLVLGENVRQTTDYVEKGDADAAIVALALVIQGSRASYALIDASLHEPITQGGAVIAGTGAEITGRCILQYLLDPSGRAALERFGFEPVQR